MSASTNLTRAECAERSAAVPSAEYRVELDLRSAPGPGAAPAFRSSTTVIFPARAGASEVWLDLLAESVEQITFNGRELDVSQVWDGARIRLPALAAENTVKVVAQCRYMKSGEGLHRFVDPVDSETYLYSQFEVADARRVFACFEQPDIKGTWQLTVTAPDHWQVISNSPSPEPTKVESDAAEWRFEPTPPIPTYITAIVAGPYHSVSDRYDGPHGSYPLKIFCRRSLADALDPDDIFEVTKQGMAFFEEAFGLPYPFDKYDQAFVPEFNAGAMENAACVTYLEDYVFRSRVTQAAFETRANTILHELAHMWFGNLVTMRWWDDLWLNEAFAEWAAHFASVEATRYTTAWTTFLNQRKTWAYRQDQLPSTHPIAADMVDLEAVQVNFDGITYAKGAAALRQLVAWVGEDPFLTGVRQYFRDHAWSNTDLSDLLRALGRASGRNLGGWSRQWLETSGVNLLRPAVGIDAAGNYAIVDILQEPPSSPAGLEPVLRDHRIRVGCYRDQSGVLVRERQVELDVSGPRTEINELRGLTRADLLLVNDDDLTYAKIRLDEGSLRTAISSIGDLGDSLARALIFGATWDMTRDAEMPVGDYLKLILSGLPSETDIGVVQQLLRQVQLAIDLYSEPRYRDGYVSDLESTLASWLAQADPGSDRQLALMRALAEVASSSGNTALLRGLLSNSREIPGLKIDTDLRWALLKRLVIRGLADRSDIEAELTRDNTATGLRHAQQAIAQLPDPVAKAAAWNTVLHDQQISNHMLAATIAGIMTYDHRDFLRPHIEQYFDAIERIAAERTTEMAHQIIAGLYPGLLIEPHTITRTGTYLAHHRELEPSVRRLLEEGLDGVLRAMRCQERDTR
ncbi:MAG: aminopeptidase N [Candidatus Nanopelagicales bacterium]|nr:aminopeptidase N [Candidatus Nanopelagicales bacterium]